MSSKPAKYGLKFWVLADAQTYHVSYIAMYTGKDTSVDRGTRSLGQQVVISATEHIPAGRNVTTDNFFTSLPLIRELLRRNLTLLEIIRSHRREISKEVRKPENRELYSSKFIFTTTVSIPIQLVSYKAKRIKVVLLLSSAHSDAKIKQNDPKKKPEVVAYYNHTKGDVDVMDRMTSNYSVKYKTRRWHVVVFCNIIDIACLNAFVLFTEIFPNFERCNSRKRRLFLIELGTQLSASYRDSRNMPFTVDSYPKSAQALPKRTKCSVCWKSKVDRKTKY